MIKKLALADIPQVVKIHRQELPGFLSQMGEDFLNKFYEVSLTIPEIFTLVEKKDEQISGFVSGTTSAKGLYKKVILKDILPFIFIFLRYFITHPKNIVRAVRILTYPGFTDDIPELLTIAVEKNYRDRGIGRKLFQETVKQLQKKGAKKFRVSVYGRLPANNFYIKMGCRMERSFTFLGEKMNYYVYEFP